MKYRIETSYAWDNRETMLILIYFIQGIPFTFDELPEIARQHPEVLQIAKEEKSWEPEELYRASMYLMMEECHPMLYELDIENPELLPLDWQIHKTTLYLKSNQINAPVAQLVERGFCKADVVGSSPIGGFRVKEVPNHPRNWVIFLY